MLPPDMMEKMWRINNQLRASGMQGIEDDPQAMQGMAQKLMTGQGTTPGLQGQIPQGLQNLAGSPPPGLGGTMPEQSMRPQMNSLAPMNRPNMLPMAGFQGNSVFPNEAGGGVLGAGQVRPPLNSPTLSTRGQQPNYPSTMPAGPWGQNTQLAEGLIGQMRRKGIQRRQV